MFPLLTWAPERPILSLLESPWLVSCTDSPQNLRCSTPMYIFQIADPILDTNNSQLIEEEIYNPGFQSDFAFFRRPHRPHPNFLPGCRVHEKAHRQQSLSTGRATIQLQTTFHVDTVDICRLHACTSTMYIYHTCYIVTCRLLIPVY